MQLSVVFMWVLKFMCVFTIRVRVVFLSGKKKGSGRQKPHNKILANHVLADRQSNRSCLKTGPTLHIKIALDITAVDSDIFFLYSTGTIFFFSYACHLP